jgi:uncharacterized protein (DUF342 family)
MSNGYFQLLTGERSTKIRMVPPSDGGTAVDTREMIAYLKQRNISYDVSALGNSAALAQKTEQVLEINKITCMAERECYTFTVSPDKMTFSVRFYPESEGGEKMTAAELLNDLKQRGVKYGIDEDAVNGYFACRDYCTDIIVARGTAPRQGNDGYIEYRFDTDNTARPTLLPDGSVDFFHLHILQVCGKGQVLAVLHPEDRGTPGYDITGALIRPREVKPVSFSFGKNVQLSDDRMQLISAVDGHVSLSCGAVEVSDVLDLKNIDVSTGNIDYEGNIEINGNVESNFTVHATGDINISGVVGAANIISGGNVVIARGMNGMGKGVIRAEGNVISKFLENVTVKAGGYVSSESIIQSSVDAGTEINVDGRRGFITGGRVTAGMSVSAKTLGSDMGTDTLVEVGVDPGNKERIIEIQKLIIEDRKQLETIEPVLVATKKKMAAGVRMTPEQAQHLSSLAQVFMQKKSEIESLTAEMGSLQGKLKTKNDAFVAVHDSAYPGTRIVIGELSMTLRKPAQFCRFISDGGDVRTANY